MFTSWVSAIRIANGCLISDADGLMAEYFEQLFKVNLPSRQLPTTDIQVMDAGPPINEAALSIDEVKEAVTKLRCGKAAGICNISAELLKAGSEVMILGLHAVLTDIWYSGTTLNWKRVLVVPPWKGKWDRQDCNNYRGITLLKTPGKVLAHLLLMQVRSHLLKYQGPELLGFTLGKTTTDCTLVLLVMVERRRKF